MTDAPALGDAGAKFEANREPMAMLSDRLQSKYGREIGVRDSARRVASIALLVLCCWLCANCRTHRPPLIVGVPQVTAEEMWEGMHAGLLKAVTESHFSRYWNGPTHSDDVERQIAIIDRQLSHSPAGLAVAPDNASSLISIVSKARQEGIPVVLMESELAIPMGAGVAIVETDNALAGRMAADEIGSSLSGRGSVAVVGVNPFVTSNLSRADAFEREIKSRYPAIRLVAKSFSGSSIAETEEGIEQVLDRNPDLNAILACGVSSTRAAHAILARRNQVHEIVLVGFDQDRDLENLVRRGELNAIVAQDTYRIGYLSGRTLVDMRDGKSVAERTLVAPWLFTKNNIDSPDAQRILVTYSGWDKTLCTYCTEASDVLQ